MAESENSIEYPNAIVQTQAASDLYSVQRGYPKTAAERMRAYRARKKKEILIENHKKRKKSDAERAREYRARKKAKNQSTANNIRNVRNQKRDSMRAISISSRRSPFPIFKILQNSSEKTGDLLSNVECESMNKCTTALSKNIKLETTGSVETDLNEYITTGQTELKIEENESSHSAYNTCYSETICKEEVMLSDEND